MAIHRSEKPSGRRLGPLVGIGFSPTLHAPADQKGPFASLRQSFPGRFRSRWIRSWGSEKVTKRNFTQMSHFNLFVRKTAHFPAFCNGALQRNRRNLNKNKHVTCNSNNRKTTYIHLYFLKFSLLIYFTKIQKTTSKYHLNNYRYNVTNYNYPLIIIIYLIEIYIYIRVLWL